MFETVAAYLRYLFALVFGMAATVTFAGMPFTRKNSLVVGCYTAVTFALQVLFLHTYGMDMTMKFYPLLCHLPMVLWVVLYLKQSWLIAFTCMFVAFLCCQPLRWIGTLTGVIFRSVAMNHIGYVLASFFMYYWLRKYVVQAVRPLMERSVKSCLLFCAMPAFYYLFDFISTVYTDILYSGTRIAVQFMPFVAATFYLIFILLYSTETQKQEAIRRERDLLDTQFRLAQAEFASLRQMQQNAASYRHDMRHHFALLQSLASDGRIEEMKEYLKTAESDIDAITPLHYCENETVNLILSSYANKAKQARIKLNIDAKLPDFLPFSDTGLCSLLSNALENAIQAAKQIPDPANRWIKLRLYSKNRKLCIDIRNSYQVEPVLKEGMPVSAEQGHGYGTKSMVHIVEKHGGVCQFSVKDGWFIFQASA